MAGQKSKGRIGKRENQKRKEKKRKEKLKIKYMPELRWQYL
jgi:hypothetical protein